MTDQDLGAAERNYRNAIEESRKGKRELATELSAHGGLLLVQHLRASQPATERGGEKPTALPMRLPCPSCGALHIDEGEFATKSHRTHSCQSCGMTWRPAVVPTVGVRFLPGFKNEEPTTRISDIKAEYEAGVNADAPYSSCRDELQCDAAFYELLSLVSSATKCPAQPEAPPVEGVSDDELVTLFDSYVDEQVGRRALFNLGASRSSAAKDARIREIELRLSEATDEIIAHPSRWNELKAARVRIAELEAAIRDERERCARVCETEEVPGADDAPPGLLDYEQIQLVQGTVRATIKSIARRIREEPTP